MEIRSSRLIHSNYIAPVLIDQSHWLREYIFQNRPNNEWCKPELNHVIGTELADDILGLCPEDLQAGCRESLDMDSLAT